MKIKGGLADNNGFSMIEILVVISIIGIISVVATVYVRKSFNQARDSQRLNDIRQFQNALERYANDNNEAGYPEEKEIVPGKPLLSKDGLETYMKRIPSNPKPRTEGGCGDKEYKYTRTANGKSYTIQYCLTQGISNVSAGDCVAMPTVTCVPKLAEGGCDCGFENKPCCGYCNAGQACGGGIIFVKNYRIGGANGSNFDLIAPRKICDLTPDANSCSLDADGPKNQMAWAAISETAGARSEDDGSDNTNIVLGRENASLYKAVNACANLNYNGYMDWYLPSAQELKALLTVTPTNPAIKYWSSTEYSANNPANNVVYNNSTLAPNQYSTKGNPLYVRCIRK